jgi:hypothetical protein
MKTKIKQGAVLAGVITFALTACDSERNKASAGGSADTVSTSTKSAGHPNSPGTQTNGDTAATKRDSVSNSGNADPSGRLKNQNEH